MSFLIKDEEEWEKYEEIWEVIKNKAGINFHSEPIYEKRVKGSIYVKKITFGILLHVFAKNGKYLAIIIDNSVSTCDQIIERRNKNSYNKF